MYVIEFLGGKSCAVFNSCIGEAMENIAKRLNFVVMSIGKYVDANSFLDCIHQRIDEALI